MALIGVALSSEERSARELVEAARAAEAAGFTAGWISDHFHPWNDEQGESPFVWSVLGGIAEATTTMTWETAVTCPTIRTHPAIIAQAAATSATLMPGRFFLGVGSGENLNEHILGDKWPPAAVRLEMLAEAIEVMRLLWQGGQRSFDGDYYVVENARVYDLPDEPVKVMMAAAGDQSAQLAGRVGDGLISTAPNPDTVQAFSKGPDDVRPRYGQLTVSWAATKDA